MALILRTLSFLYVFAHLRVSSSAAVGLTSWAETVAGSWRDRDSLASKRPECDEALPGRPKNTQIKNAYTNVIRMLRIKPHTFDRIKY